jgi:TRAP-type C4-dicarboxylate transport system permease small subunit
MAATTLRRLMHASITLTSTFAAGGFGVGTFELSRIRAIATATATKVGRGCARPSAPVTRIVGCGTS